MRRNSRKRLNGKFGEVKQNLIKADGKINAIEGKLQNVVTTSHLADMLKGIPGYVHPGQ